MRATDGLRSKTLATCLAALLLAGLACLASPARRDEATTPEGTFTVGENGDARYSIQLSVPPGIGGTTPTLSLTYSSQRGDDRLGVGWRLQGLSAISRCAAIPATDGFRGSVDYGPADRFCLDGQRLINVEGEYSAPGSVYRTELETWRRVTASTERCGGGPCAFTVVDRGGNRSFYGTTTDSRVLAVGRADVRVWSLAGSQDLNGNAVALRYTSTPVAGVAAAAGQSYVSEIAYTTNAAAGVSQPNRFVRFAYEPRQQALSGYVGGSRVYTQALLARVQTYLDAALVTEYRLGYQPAAAGTGRPLLTSAQQCASSDDAARCLPPTQVGYQGEATVRFRAEPLASGLPASPEGVLPLDINGDGKGDLAYLTGDASRIQVTSLISDGSRLSACPQVLQIPRPAGCKLDGSGTSRCALLPAAVDRDGKGDLVFVFANGTQLAYALFPAEESGCSFSRGPSANLGMPTAYADLWPMDANGDGLTDLVGGWSDRSVETVVTFLGSATGFARQGSRDIGLKPNQRFWPAEVNGDGMLDLVQAWHSTGGSIALTAFVSTGESFAAGTTTDLTSGSVNLEGLWPLDVNGDGKSDLVQGWAASGALSLSTFFATGAGGFVCEQPKADGSFEPGCTTATGKGLSDARAFWPMDADGDGRNDLVQAWKDGSVLRLVVYRNANTGLDRGQAADATMASLDVARVWPLDYDGDGKTDLVQATATGGSLALTGYRSEGAIPDLAATLTNSVGGRYTITYQPLSNPAVYSPGEQPPGGEAAQVLTYPYRQASAQAPFQKVGGGHMSLVAEVERVNDPATNASTYRYRDRYTYSGALSDLAGGRGWLGFRRLAKLDLASGQRMLTTLNQGFPLTGTTAEIEYQCDASFSSDPLCPQGVIDTKLTDSDTDYSAVEVAQGATAPRPKVYEVLKTSTRLTTYDYGRFDFARAKSYAYDAYGNTTLVSDWGYVDPAGRNLSTADDVFTCSAYDNQVTAQGWELGYELAQKVSSVASCSDFKQFNPATDFSLERYTYTPQRNLETRAAYDDVNRVELTTRYTYDAFGNLLSQTLPGDRRSSFRYETTYHTYARCSLSPADDRGLRLVEYRGFDPRFGVQVASTTNGTTTTDDCPPLATSGAAASPAEVSTVCLDPFGRQVARQGPIPSLPADVVGDANCLGATVTGEGTAFRAAPVVTLATFARARDERGRLYTQQSDLQDWTLAGASPVFRWSRAYVDGLGRSYLQVAEEEASVGQVASCSNFNSDDKTTRQSIPRYFADDTIACTSSSGPGSTGPGGVLWSTSTYDAYGRPTRQTSPSGPDGQATAITQIAYQKDIHVQVTQAAGTPEALTKLLDYEYFNSQRKLVQMVLPAAGGATTTFTYDRLGRLLTATDPASPSNPRGVTNTITYDSLSRRTSVDNPDQNSCLASPGSSGCAPGAKALELAYDPLTGDLATSIDAAGRVTRFHYDALGRMTGKTLPAGGTGSGSVLYGYDDPAAAHGAGRPTSVEGRDEKGTRLYRSSYAYDAYGNRSETRLELDGTTYASAQVYDPLARVIGLTYPDGFTLTQSYAMGNPQALFDAETRYVEYRDYTAVGGPQQVSYGNGTTGTYAYAPTGQPLSQQVFDARGGRLLDASLAYNTLLQVTGTRDLLRPGGTDFSQTFRYAGTRLTAASAPGLYGDLAFGYDAAGDLTAKDGYTYTYQAHRIAAGTGAGLPAFAAHYDLTGNLDRRSLGNEAWSYRYDVRNRLVAAQKGDETLLSVPLYDDAGNRLKKLTPDGVETIYVSPLYQLTRFPDGSSEVTKVLASAGGTVATLTTAEKAVPAAPGVPVPGTLFFVRDYLGSTSLTTGEDGLLRSRMAYVPYGGVFQPGVSGPDDFRPKFQGQELDQAAALYYFGARYYDPALGRFLTADTQLGSDLTTLDSLNRFAFALNNPVTFIDPTGHSVWDAIGGFLIGATEIVLGVAVDVLSDGALEPVGGALIGAGLNGVTYSVTNSSNFSWKQYGVQQGEGALIGLFTAGFGSEAEPGVSLASSEAAEEVAASTASQEAAELAAQSEGRELASAADEGFTEAESAAGRSEDLGEAGEGEFCTASFPAGETVWASQGRLAVETLSGAEVLRSRSSIDGQEAAKPLTLTLQRLTSELIALEVTGDGGRTERFVTTPNHPFFVLDRGWVPAAKLTAGQHLSTVDGEGAELTAVSPFQADEPVRVYNLEVADFHSYFVGDLGLWVHNPRCVEDGVTTNHLNGEERASLRQLQDEADWQINASRDIPSRQQGKVTVAFDRQSGQFYSDFSGSGGRGISPRSQLGELVVDRTGGQSQEGWHILSCSEVKVCQTASEAGTYSGRLDIATFDAQTGNLVEPCRNCSRWIYELSARVFIP